MKTLLFAITLIIALQQATTQIAITRCFEELGCAGNQITASDEETCCLDTDALSYNMGDQCVNCFTFGFLEPVLRNNESGPAYTFQVGYIKNPDNATQVLQGMIQAIDGTAGDDDFSLNSNIYTARPNDPGEILVRFTVDNVAQEQVETAQLQLDILAGITQPPGLIIRDTMTLEIVDRDIVAFQFTENNYRSAEDAGTIDAVISKNLRIANPVTFQVFPYTVQQAEDLGLDLMDLNIPPNDNMYSPNRAQLDRTDRPPDFNNSILTVTFEADEDLLNPVNDIPVPIPINDDDIDEAQEEVFIINMQLQSSINPTGLQIGRALSLCRINDNDVIQIGFQSDSYTFPEPDLLQRHTIFLEKQNGVRTEQTYFIVVQASQVSPPGVGNAEPFDGTNFNDYTIVQDSTVDNSIPIFLPNEQTLAFGFTLFGDQIAEGLEAFQVSSAADEDPLLPAFSAPNAGVLFPTAFINIADNAIECPRLPDITNGMITYVPDTTPDLLFGTTTTYECDKGYFLNVTMGDRVRTCEDDDGRDAIGVWSGMEPSCVLNTAIQCLELPLTVNGFITYTPDTVPNFDLGTVATYDCNTGFALDLSMGAEMRTCVDGNGMDAIGVWTDSPPTCIHDVTVGFEMQNFIVPEDVGSYEVCFRVLFPLDDAPLTINDTVGLVVDSVEGTADEMDYEPIRSSELHVIRRLSADIRRACFDVMINADNMRENTEQFSLVLSFDQDVNAAVRDLVTIQPNVSFVDIIDADGVQLELAISIPVLMGLVLVIVVCVIVICCILYIRRRMRRNSKNLEHSMEQYYETIPERNESKIYEETTQFDSYESNVELAAKLLPSNVKIPFSKLKVSKTAIGAGEIGIVYKGILLDWNHVPITEVAIKALKGFSLSDTEIENMISEVMKMKELNHPHVMPLLGVCLDAHSIGAVSIVMPYMVKGSLLAWLKKERSSIQFDDDCDIDQMLAARKLLLRMCHQIVMGMEYVAEQKFIHRDLAARNCLLDSQGNIKVGDFGLAEDVYASGYYREDNRSDMKLPFKWMALESLTDFVFSEKTDVWSYGVTMWEVFSGGRTPYPSADPVSLKQFLKEGKRLRIPRNAACTTEISDVMCQCWMEDPEERPTFAELTLIMDRLLMSLSGYAELRKASLIKPVLHDIAEPPISGPSASSLHVPIANPSNYGLQHTDIDVLENSAYGLGGGMDVEENSAYGLREEMVVDKENDSAGLGDGMETIDVEENSARLTVGEGMDRTGIDVEESSAGLGEGMVIEENSAYGLGVIVDAEVINACRHDEVNNASEHWKSQILSLLPLS